MENGLYGLTLLIGDDYSQGLVVARDQCINGGDGTRIFQGEFEQAERRIKGIFTVTNLVVAPAPRPVSLSSEAPLVFTLTGAGEQGHFHMLGRGAQGVMVEVSGRLLATACRAVRDRTWRRGRDG